MTTVQFQAQLEADGTIRLPAGVNIAPGPVKVVISTVPATKPADPGQSTEPAASTLFADLAKLAIDGPADLAENHDFYAHGAPKGIDQQ